MISIQTRGWERAIPFVDNTCQRAKLKWQRKCQNTDMVMSTEEETRQIHVNKSRQRKSEVEACWVLDCGFVSSAAGYVCHLSNVWINIWWNTHKQLFETPTEKQWGRSLRSTDCSNNGAQEATKEAIRHIFSFVRFVKHYTQIPLNDITVLYVRCNRSVLLVITLHLLILSTRHITQSIIQDSEISYLFEA